MDLNDDFKEAKRIICEGALPVTPVFLVSNHMTYKIQECLGAWRIVLGAVVRPEEHKRLTESAIAAGGWHARSEKVSSSGF